ncbi:NAD(P)/FAD-dependent oxidoreductase [Pararhodobacter oceanensis]|uniref:Ferredoxin reductase n=1 Tax=Pararhodobacter oceanensis TaxID=2172121 RepID=A0A2T8HZ11_9RHOB|nr:FAD-dependent oxidoreductase [Pararhodobacter oceanensis]PVH30668.1 ferredoxin reductase [Pararhodobacter oceanensis]
MTGIVIIGAGECGVRAAFELRARGYGGSVALVNGEAGLPYERPPLSKRLGSAPILIKSAAAFAEADIHLRSGQTALYIDSSHKTVALADGETLDYDRLLIATGARARVFSGMETCLTLRTDEDAAAIMAQLKPGARIGIIGGGFIGLELAATAVKAGAEVTVVEGAARLLQRAVPAPIADILHQRHAAEGVTILTETGVATAEATSITLADGTVQGFDLVIAGVGALPNTELAHKTGLAVTNGIVVNESFQTSDPHIYAAGDCCNFTWRGARLRLESWKAAQDQGAHAAAAMLGEASAYNAVPWFWSDQYDLTLQVAGLFDISAPVHTRPTVSGQCLLFQCNAQGCLTAVAGIGSGNSIAKDISIFEKLIARGAAHDPAVLQDPEHNLKRLLRAA